MLGAWVLGVCWWLPSFQETSVEGARLVRLARETVLASVRGSAAPTLDRKSPPKPVFVTLEVKGVIRGCRGSLDVSTDSLEAEIVRAAQMACRHDPRYAPIQPKELASMLVTVTVVDRLEPISAVGGLAQADGLVLKAGDRVGVVLPWEGKDPKVRLDWAYRKAGVPAGSSARLYRLVGERYRG